MKDYAKEGQKVDKEKSNEELEEIMASKLRELGMPESSIEYWINHPEEMIECIYEALEFKKKEK